MRSIVIGYIVVSLALSTSSLLAATLPTSGSSSNFRGIAIGDVLGMEHLDQVEVSPDGDTIAVVIQRPAIDGEVYGRTAYETDPSRNDVWLISRASHERRNITNGSAAAAGFWCTSWSPDGQRLAMLSTNPEGAEPHGGDNVRLYVWDRAGNKLSRLGDAAMMTQTRYGGAIHRLDIRGGADHSDVTHSCSKENAPFAWLDDHRLLAVTLPYGHLSALFDEASRPYRVEALDSQRLHDGKLETGEALGSGAERTQLSPDESAVIQTVDVTTKAWNFVATVPDYPFAGDLTVSVAPDGKKAAVAVPVSVFQPAEGRHFPHTQATDWLVEKRVGIIDLSTLKPIRWIPMPPTWSHPLELLAWAPDSRRLALRSRRDAFDRDPVLLFADAKTGQTTAIGVMVMDQEQAGSIELHDQQLFWLDAHDALARLRDPNGSRLDWWLIGLNGTNRNLTSSLREAPSALRKLSIKRLVAIDGRNIVSLNPDNSQIAILADIGAEGGSFLSMPESSSLIVATPGSDEHQTVRAIDYTGAMGPGIDLPSTAVPMSAGGNRLLWRYGDQSGLFLKDTDLNTARTTSLLSLNGGLSSLAWGKTIFFDYNTIDGKAVKGAAILPPDYKSGRRYPTLVWVYEGHRIDPNSEYFLDPQMPGFYNLQLYAAKGYVVLLPSMPLPREDERKDVYAAVTNGVLPAINKLKAMGIIDAGRVGVFGQSYGGYSVYALISQSDCFKAGVAMAGITDLVGFYEQPDPLARGYTGIEHEKSSNWFIIDQFGLHDPPTSSLDQYWRNSPLTHVSEVHTPLLMLHGTHDIRGDITQADQFFYALYTQGKTARLVRYGGESHSLAQSPANIRDVFRETVDWFDKYVKNTPLN